MVTMSAWYMFTQCNKYPSIHPSINQGKLFICLFLAEMIFTKTWLIYIYIYINSSWLEWLFSVFPAIIFKTNQLCNILLGNTHKDYIASKSWMPFSGSRSIMPYTTRRWIVICNYGSLQYNCKNCSLKMIWCRKWSANCISQKFSASPSSQEARSGCHQVSWTMWSEYLTCHRQIPMMGYLTIHVYVCL